jgi:hypothetical protein
MQAMEDPSDDLHAICAATLSATKGGSNGSEGVSALTALLRARQQVARLFTAPVVVSFLGVESGKVEMLVRVARDTDAPIITGE